MAIEVYDENKLRDLPDAERLAVCEKIIKNDSDESKRWDAVWLIGELAENKTEEDPTFNKAADLMEWVLPLLAKFVTWDQLSSWRLALPKATMDNLLKRNGCPRLDLVLQGQKNMNLRYFKLDASLAGCLGS